MTKIHYMLAFNSSDILKILPHFYLLPTSRIHLLKLYIDGLRNSIAKSSS